MGISQHIHGTDNARCLISLALVTGQIGRPGTGLHPLRGQNNVQGASDVGLIPMMFPDYQRVDNAGAHTQVRSAVEHEARSKPGLTVTEIMDAVHADVIHGMYIMGENPAMSDPNVEHAREALAKLEHLVVQEIFLTETALRGRHPAGDGLSGEDRHVHQHRSPRATGAARRSIRRATRARTCGSSSRSRAASAWTGITPVPADVFAEMRLAMPSMGGITWERLEGEVVDLPLKQEGDPGEPVVFIDDFPSRAAAGSSSPATYTHAEEMPDKNIRSF